jgi:sugar lactone lactonase YvrE
MDPRMSWEVRRPAFVDVAGDDQNVEQLGTGFGFTEGPVWDARVGRLVFSDMKHDHMRSWTAPGDRDVPEAVPKGQRQCARPRRTAAELRAFD